MVTLIARLTAQPGKEALLAEECARMRKIVREQEQGCLMYIPHAAADNPAEIIFIEKYVDQDALDAHSQSPHFKHFREATKDLVAERFPLQFLKELG